MSNEIPREDYVMVPRRKVRISGARKLMLGVMAVGAVAAVGGAGTFASFSASTSNDATFTSGTLILSNKVPSGNTCWSSRVGPDAADGAAAADTDLDTNDTNCDSLFGVNLLPGVQNDTWVTLKNEGTASGVLKVFSPAASAALACVNAAGPHNVGTNEVQTVTISATGGTFTITFGANTTTALAFDATAAAVQNALGALGSIGHGNIGVTKAGSVYTLTFKGTLAATNVAEVTTTATGLTGGAGTATPATTVAGVAGIQSASGSEAAAADGSGLCSRVDVQIQQVDAASSNTAVVDSGCVYPYVAASGGGGVCTTTGLLNAVPIFSAANSHNGTFASAATRHYRIRMTMKKTVTAEDATCDANGFKTDGKGCDNKYMNAKATVSLRWQLQAS